MKLNLTLTGEVEVALYKYTPESEFPTATVGHRMMPGKLTLTIRDEFCRFNFWDYSSVDVSHPEPAEKVIRKGKFSLQSTSESLRSYKNKDISDIEWRRFSVKGKLEWIRDRQKFIEFAMEIPDNSVNLFVRAIWPQRAYPRGPLKMEGQSTILSLNEESIERFSQFWSEIRRKGI